MPNKVKVKSGPNSGLLVLPNVVLPSLDIERRSNLRQKVEPITRETEYRYFACYSRTFYSLYANAHSPFSSNVRHPQSGSRVRLFQSCRHIHY